MSELAFEFENRRIAAAFGLEHWRNTEEKYNLRWHQSVGKEPMLRWRMNLEAARADWFEWVPLVSSSKLWREFRLLRNYKWELIGNAFEEELARGLYCLGFEDESILSQLPPLSAHEKLELRLSMPREFWPEGWEK